MTSPVAIVAAKSPIEKATANRPLATQQAALQRWLESSAKAPSAPARFTPPAHPHATKNVANLPANEKVATLRDALAANGLAIAPGIHHLPALHKVVRLEDLLRHNT
ncbi:MAG: hypothetical protein RL173_2855 [Fibrobacterota bacterium]|jgi:hypothetical protein